MQAALSSPLANGDVKSGYIRMIHMWKYINIEIVGLRVGGNLHALISGHVANCFREALSSMAKPK